METRVIHYICNGIGTEMTDFRNRLKTLVEAGTPIIQVITYETLRMHAFFTAVASETGRKAYVWNRTEGLRQYVGGKIKIVDEDMTSPSAILEWYQERDNTKLMLLLEDFHPDLDSRQPATINRLRCIARKSSMRELDDKTLIMSQPIKQLPVELEKEVIVLELPLPDKDDIRELLLSVGNRFLDPRDFNQCSTRLIDAALGLSTAEVMSAFSCVAVERKSLTDAEVPLIVAEKEQVIRKSGHLEYYQPTQDFDDIGGLNNLKDWLSRRRRAFEPMARDFGLEEPRGIMLLGLPGTGKSLAAKAVANAWQLPLLRLDMGRIFGGIVGQSEENMRSSLNIAETLAPCILWIDEIEKGMAGIQSSGTTDGGVTARVLGTFLTWMQEKKKPVFVVATANNIAQLPPELLRKGRVDEIFFVDLPTVKEREDILNIHISKKSRKTLPAKQVEKLAEESKGFTGAELEEAVKDAMYRAFDDDRELSAEDISAAIKATTPLSQTMRDVINDTRKWAKGRAVMASIEEPEELEDKSEEAIRLPQECYNPFSKV